MFLRTYIKVILFCAVSLNVCYFLIWILHQKTTRYRNLEIHRDEFKSVIKRKSLLDVTLKPNKKDGYATEKTTTKHRYASNITLNPDIPRILSLNVTHLKVPPMSDMKFLLENKSTCEVENLTLFIMIHSAPGHFERRKAIRETWTNARQLSSVAVVRTIFLLGRPSSSTLHRLVIGEFMKFGDIVQGDFEDSYRNLSLNSLFGLKWANENCANAKLIVKSDDDIVVNINMFLHLVKEKSILEKTKQIMCFRCLAPIYRNRTDKYYIDENVFKGHDYTPWFCEGKFVMMTRDLIPDMLESASITPLLWIEDVYMYGLVMLSIPNVGYNQVSWFEEIEPYTENAKKCLRSKTKCEFFITWVDTVDQIKEIWSLMDLYNKTPDRVTSHKSKRSFKNVVVHINKGANGTKNSMSVN